MSAVKSYQKTLVIIKKALLSDQEKILILKHLLVLPDEALDEMNQLLEKDANIARKLVAIVKEKLEAIETRSESAWHDLLNREQVLLESITTE